MKKRFGLACAAMLVALGCGSSDSSTATETPVVENPPGWGKAGFTFKTGEFEIQPGDTFECFYTDTVTPKQLNIRSAFSKQGPGGHHITVYYTDQKVEPNHHPCTDVEMVGLHQVAGGNETKSDDYDLGLPPGYATKVPAGKQLVVQAHYIRTEKTPLKVNDEVILYTLEDNEVKSFANSFVINDGAFKLAPRSNNTASSDCVLKRDYDVLLLLGHMHEWGSHYKLDRVDEKGTKLETIYETDWEPIYSSHPPINKYAPEKPLHLTKGTRLRQTCTWKNTEDHEMAFPREMCVMFTYYIPDEGFDVCDSTEVKQ